MPTKSLLHRIESAFLSILQGNLTGLYIHGSIAFGCFRWDRSDVDFIAVTERPLTDDACRKLLSAMLALGCDAPPKGLEMSVVLRAHCVDFVYPTPYELHFSPMWSDAARTDPDSLIHHPRRADPDLAAHFTVIRAVGYPLCGAPVAEVFGSVPRANYLDSIWADVRNARTDIRQNPVYIVLNLCRVLALIRDDTVLSKQGGGEWGLRNLPTCYHPLVQSALIDYVGGVPMPRDAETEDAFARYMLDRIEPRSST